MEPTKNLNTKMIGVGLALLLLAVTPLASAHGASMHNLASGQLVCVGPPHIIAAGGTITVPRPGRPPRRTSGWASAPRP